MRTAEEEILRDVLGRMADEAPDPIPFEEIDSIVVRPQHAQRTPWLTKQPLLIASAAALLILVLGVGASLLSNRDGEGVYVADGEALIATDPPIVQGSESPEPSFDTGAFGDEVPLAPVADIPKILNAANTLQSPVPGEILRITVLGETPEGVLALIVHAEGEDLRGNPIQLRCQTTTLGGTQTCGEGPHPEDVVDMPGGLIPAQPGGGATYSVGEAPASADTMIWEVPAETSVVTLTVNDETRWQRPVAGVAVFITDLVYGDSFELAAFDARGNTLDSVSVVTRHSDQ